MKIDFKNIGPLHECKVELGDLTIVTGHNNTGKTFVTYGVFGLLAGWRHWLRLTQFQATAQELVIKNQVDLDMQQFSGAAFRTHLTRLAHIYQENLPRILASEPERFTDTKVHLDMAECPQIETLVIDLRQVLPSGDSVTITKLAGEMIAKITRQASTSENGTAGIPPLIHIERWLHDTFTEIIFSPCFPRAYIASTERTGATIFQRELYLGRNRLIEMLADFKPGERLDPWAMMQRMASSYAFPVQQNVEFLSLPNLEALQRQESQLATDRPDILEALEEIVGGTYRTTKEGAYFSPKGHRGLKLRLGESSSAVRSLLDVTYYIRHVLRPGDCFMIDEPELNLHPHNQRLFARLIGRMVNAGIKVFLTTHSDYIIRELNTLILLSGRKQTRSALLEQLSYSEKELVPASGVRFYRTAEALRKGDGKTRRSTVPVLEEVPVNPTTGIAVASFDEEIDKLNEIQDTIIYTVEAERKG